MVHFCSKLLRCQSDSWNFNQFCFDFALRKFFRKSWKKSTIFLAIKMSKILSGRRFWVLIFWLYLKFWRIDLNFWYVRIFQKFKKNLKFQNALWIFFGLYQRFQEHDKKIFSLIWDYFHQTDILRPISVPNNVRKWFIFARNCLGDKSILEISTKFALISLWENLFENREKNRQFF